jgi:hypothetical protein
VASTAPLSKPFHGWFGQGGQTRSAAWTHPKTGPCDRSGLLDPEGPKSHRRDSSPMLAAETVIIGAQLYGISFRTVYCYTERMDCSMLVDQRSMVRTEPLSGNPYCYGVPENDPARAMFPRPHGTLPGNHGWCRGRLPGPCGVPSKMFPCFQILFGFVTRRPRPKPWFTSPSTEGD